MKTFVLVLLILALISVTYSESDAYTLSGNVEGGVFLGGITYIYAISLDFTSFPPNIYFGLNLLGVGGYTILNVEEGSYFLFAYQDRDNNLLPSIDDYFGYYGGGVPEILEVNGSMDNLDISIAPIPFTTIDGELSYSGPEEGLTLIEAASDPEFENIEYFSFSFDFSGNGSYTIFVEPGEYYIRAYIDLDNSFSLSGDEPTGYYGAPGAPEVVDASSGSVSGIDFIIFDDTMPNLEIILEPESQNIVIPFWGGSFDFDVTLRNNEATVQEIQAWTEIVYPDGSLLTPVILRDIAMTPGMEIFRSLTQEVPASAPWGDYSYRARMGEYPDIVIAQDSFPFEKGLFDGSETSWAGHSSWNSYGWDAADEMITPELPVDHMILNAAPNPFNPTTQITYQMSSAGYLKLSIFDIAGREITRLVEGYKPAGNYTVVFDGSNLSSGVYFSKLEAGGITQTQKLLLMK